LTNNLYTILLSDENIVKIQLTNKEHPIFKAHFPNNPILPGFLQIDIIAEILCDKLKKINRCKFIAHILPNDIIDYQITVKDTNKKQIKIIKNNKKISEFTYETI